MEIDFDSYGGQLRPLTWSDSDLVAQLERETMEELCRAAAKKRGGDTMNLERRKEPDFVEEIEPEPEPDDEEEERDDEDEEDVESA